MKRILFPGLVFCLLPFFGFGQCATGEEAVEIHIHPDFAGHEITWDLKRKSDQFVYGSGGPYPTGSTTPVIQTVCVDSAENATFLIRDLESNGMCCLFGNGYYAIVHNADTIFKNGDYLATDSITFLVPSKAKDGAIYATNIYPFEEATSKTIQGTFVNLGTNLITSFRANYLIDGSTQVLQIVSGVSVPSGGMIGFTISNPWIPTPGSHTVSVWPSVLNLAPDENSGNDTIHYEVFVVETLATRFPLVEAFTSTTDPAGIFSESILDSLIGDNAGQMSVLKFHVGFPTPGDDPMHLFDSSLNNQRVNFYNIPPSLPQAVLDGIYFKGPAYGIEQSRVNQLYDRKSVFNIQLDETFNGNTVNIDVKTTSLVPLPGHNLRCFVAIKEDPLGYPAPPGPSGQTTFNHVARALLPGSTGAVIGAPAQDQVNDFTFSYTMDTNELVHSNLRTVVWVQDLTTGEIFQSLPGDTVTGFNHASTINGLGFSSEARNQNVIIFPNPCSLEFNLKISDIFKTVTRCVLVDITGRALQIWNGPFQTMNQTIHFSLNGVLPGLYFLKIESSGSLESFPLVVIQ